MNPRRMFTAAAVLIAGCAPPGASSADDLAARPLPAAIVVQSPAFADGGTVPARFTCDGAGVSPPLAWSGVPAGTSELAVVVDDPDAPRGTYVHWVVFGLDPGLTNLEEGVLPAGARQAESSGGEVGFVGPCPPGGSAHLYRFSVYALGETLDVPDGSGGGDALAAIAEAAIAVGRLTGRYGRG
jgi:Raf kinase inhibitor-like YbhB/YbcL family protein